MGDLVMEGLTTWGMQHKNVAGDWTASYNVVMVSRRGRCRPSWSHVTTLPPPSGVTGYAWQPRCDHPNDAQPWRFLPLHEHETLHSEPELHSLWRGLRHRRGWPGVPLELGRLNREGVRLLPNILFYERTLMNGVLLRWVNLANNKSVDCHDVSMSYQDDFIWSAHRGGASTDNVAFEKVSATTYGIQCDWVITGLSNANLVWQGDRCGQIRV